MPAQVPGELPLRPQAPEDTCYNPAAALVGLA